MPLSNEDLRRRLAKQQWTAHNIRLSSEVVTMPGQPDFMESDLRLKAIVRILSLLYHGRLADLHVADLGCLEGGFALALAQNEANALGIEARARELEKATLLKEHFELPNLRFIQGDVKDFTSERFGRFDVVLALGILYHLDKPALWLNQIASATKAVLIVDTHYAPSDDASLAVIDPRLARLSQLEQIEVGGWTSEGRWFTEYADNEDREKQVWASYSNRKSFWLTKESILLALMRSGFDLVLEQHDYSASFFNYFTTAYPRGMFIAIKSSGFLPHQ